MNFVVNTGQCTTVDQIISSLTCQGMDRPHAAQLAPLMLKASQVSEQNDLLRYRPFTLSFIDKFQRELAL